jgi:hypothetical protein
MKITKLGLLSLVLPLVLLGCGHNDNNEQEVQAPHTGNELFEAEKVPLSRISMSHFAVNEKTYYVYTNRLNVRSSAEVRADNLVGALGLNDEVKIVSEVINNDFVQIEVLKSNAKLQSAPAYFVAKDYLSETKNDSRDVASRSKYFMIQNVATETLRVYEKQCDDGRCAHKMILEAEVAVGEKNKDRARMTVLGSFNIAKWVKFYQDGAGLYPSWYDPSYPAVPAPHASVMSWTSAKVLPNKAAKVRGAFGWYTALVAPDSHNQWTHGTLGWGEDKKKYITATHGAMANLFADPRSHGCTRTDNESIAYIRSLLPPGTPVLKVYAVERLADSTRARYSEKEKRWDYIMTKNGVRVDGEIADRDTVLAHNTPKEQWIEQGTYTADVYPDVEEFRSGSKGAKSGKNGNVYGLDTSEMHGVFLIDEGRLVNYAHPTSLQVGGYGRNSFPDFVISKENNLP